MNPVCTCSDIYILFYFSVYFCSVWNSDHKNHSRDKDKTSDISNYKSRALTSSAEEDNLKDRDSNK